MFTQYNFSLFNFLFLLLFAYQSLSAQDRDPFLSPFEPRKPIEKAEPSANNAEKPSSDKTQPKPNSLLEIDKTNKIKLALNEGQLEKASTLLEELKKEVSEKSLPETDKNILASFEDQIKNFNKYKELLKTTRELMTIQGKILLSNKKNMLLINNQPVTEGEDLTDLLKLEFAVFLNNVKEDSFTLRFKDIIQSFHIE